MAYGIGMGLEKAVTLGVLPFIGVDILKAIAAATVATTLLPKSGYGAEGR